MLTPTTVYLDEDVLDGAVIGVWRDGTYDPTADPEITQLLDDTVATLEAAGATVVDPANIDITDDSYIAEFAALLCESKDDMTGYLNTYAPDFPDGYSNDLQGLLDFNNDHPELEGPEPALWDLAVATDGRDSDCADARAAATPPVQDPINDLMADNNLDLIAPTNGPAWVTSDDPTVGDDFSHFAGSSSAAVISGYADIVPAGYIGPLPLGITFIGGRWMSPVDRPRLRFRAADPVRTPPEFLATWSGDSALRRAGKSHPAAVHNPLLRSPR
jgi:amidase